MFPLRSEAYLARLPSWLSEHDPAVFPFKLHCEQNIGSTHTKRAHKAHNTHTQRTHKIHAQSTHKAHKASHKTRQKTCKQKHTYTQHAHKTSARAHALQITDAQCTSNLNPPKDAGNTNRQKEVLTDRGLVAIAIPSWVVQRLDHECGDIQIRVCVGLLHVFLNHLSRANHR